MISVVTIKYFVFLYIYILSAKIFESSQVYDEVLFVAGPRLVQHIAVLNEQAKHKEFLM